MTARLLAGDARVEVTIIDYSFPDLVTIGGIRIENDYEANWLDVIVAATDGRTHLRVPKKSCLLNWEVVELARWMEKLAAGRRPRWGFSGIETRPAFQLSDDGTRLEVGLDPSTYPFELSLSPDSDSIAAFARQLKQEVAPFRLRVLERNGPANRVAVRFRALEAGDGGGTRGVAKGSRGKGTAVPDE